MLTILKTDYSTYKRYLEGNDLKDLTMRLIDKTFRKSFLYNFNENHNILICFFEED